MKIKSVDSFLLSLPYRTSGGFHYIAGRPSNALAMLLVRLRTEDGLEGWGEAFGHAGAVATKSMIDSLVAPLLVGEDPGNIGVLMETIRRKVHLFAALHMRLCPWLPQDRSDASHQVKQPQIISKV